MVCCHRHTFVVNSDGQEGLHWFVCAIDCRVWSDRFIIWVWEPLSSISLIRFFFAELKRHGFTTEHRALEFQKDGSSYGFQSLHITNVVEDHRGSLSDVCLTPMPLGFVDYVLDIVNADRFV